MTNLEMYERFKKEIPGVGLYPDRGCFYLGFNDGKNLFAYEQVKFILGYGGKKNDVYYRALLLPLDGEDTFGGSFHDFMIKVRDSGLVYVIDRTENLLFKCDFAYDDNYDKFWKCVRILAMKLKLMGLV